MVIFVSLWRTTESVADEIFVGNVGNNAARDAAGVSCRKALSTEKEYHPHTCDYVRTGTLYRGPPKSPVNSRLPAARMKVQEIFFMATENHSAAESDRSDLYGGVALGMAALAALLVANSALNP